MKEVWAGKDKLRYKIFGFRYSPAWLIGVPYREKYPYENKLRVLFFLPYLLPSYPRTLYSRKVFPMKEITILDKTFVESISEANLQARIADLGRILTRDYQDKNPVVIGILNGAFLFVADVVRNLGFDPEIYFMRLSSYHGGTESTGKITPLLTVNIDVTDRDVIILEDIVDTGTTLEWIRGHFAEKGARSVAMATLLFKHEVFTKSPDPEYYCFKIANEFVVGYGLDYAEHGRNLRSIYKLKV